MAKFNLNFLQNILHIFILLNTYCVHVQQKDHNIQRAKEVVSDSPALVDFAIGLVNSVFNLPNGQVTFLEEFE